jgi:hypothetical protein
MTFEEVAADDFALVMFADKSERVVCYRDGTRKHKTTCSENTAAVMTDFEVQVELTRVVHCQGS